MRRTKTDITQKRFDYLCEFRTKKDSDGREVKGMEVKLTGTAEEIAALVLQLQGRREGSCILLGQGGKSAAGERPQDRIEIKEC